MKYFLILVFCGIIGVSADAQDTVYARRLISQLASPAMEGRGFARRADLKAARFLSGEMKSLGLVPLSEGYFHPYTFSANTFPVQISLKLNNRLLRPQEDFIISLSSPQSEDRHRVVRLFNDSLKDQPGLKALLEHDLTGAVIITDKFHRRLADSLPEGVAGIFFVADSGKLLVWRNSDAVNVNRFVSGTLSYNTLLPGDTVAEWQIETEYITNGEAVDVAGMVRGSRRPGRYMMVTAHYDHLGLMGEGNYYPGANDNASGVAMMLDLARYFSLPANQPECSLLFAAFSGEESGLWGSKAFAANLPVPADSIMLVLNLDMVGTGSEGITVVNGEANPALYEKMVKINADNEYIATVKQRGPSCNSDHCPFDKIGIPAIFIYSMGKEWPYYHVPNDNDRLPLTEYSDIFSLLRDFLNTVPYAERIR